MLNNSKVKIFEPTRTNEEMAKQGASMSEVRTLYITSSGIVCNTREEYLEAVNG